MLPVCLPVSHRLSRLSVHLTPLILCSAPILSFKYTMTMGCLRSEAHPNPKQSCYASEGASSRLEGPAGRQFVV
jgi:hypothetical protein